MARPKKQTVDYFPHYVNTGRSLSIVQSQHGNDGYAFWFKLLQVLGKTEGHVYDYNNPDDWLFLLAETNVPGEKAEQILETLASVGSIDKELWGQKIIWSQHFVDNVADVYKRRQVDLPVRPGNSLPEVNQGLIQAVEHFDKLGDKIDDMIEYYEQELGRVLSPMDLDKLKDFADNYDIDAFKHAVDEAKKGKARSPMNYIEKVMLNKQDEEKPAEKSTDNQGVETI
ncbi:hypothetical protein LCGC14_0981140 [marine sediment metagenome]|uniref:Lin1244/Lin1753-like N-terminal domain-containing protein n=1 Tax=marine sediment metagenome TaxID=412755 RepID=A0A0F9NV20_9ZZZZ